ncbi:uDENN domain-containing protein [Cladophialophora immunda]|nr:uDENN domain-containing protein [Cladophialophora immunda]
MPSTPETPESARPLADHFWIAGLDSQQLVDAFSQPRWSHDHFDTNGVDFSIKEEASADNEQSSILQSPRASIGHSRHDSYQRLSQLSDEARETIQSLHEATKPRSNRSSLTIRAAAGPASDARMSSLISEADFEKAMTKFATDRDAFYLDLTFHPNESTKPARSKSRPKTQKIIAQDESTPVPNRNFGSIRRHLSFKDMSSTKRQPSMARRTSTRTSRRMSSYNSVIPSPETFHSSPDQHPLMRKFEPVLLERYPRPSTFDKHQSRAPFPDYVPMFAFPNDIKIVAADTRPRSIWHEFSMTAADNSRLTAVTVIIWIPVNRDLAADLEKRCEQWRKAHMSEAEREMATSLAERLAAESAKLSRLLTQLPQLSPDSAEREALEDEIGTVEEKIAVMSDMLRPLRHSSESDIQGLAGGETRFWIPRAYGILGKDKSMANFWRQWLRAIVVPMTDGGVLRVPASSPKVGMWQPLERYVAALCLEAPCPVSSKTQVQIPIRELQLYAKKEAANELPGSRTTDLYPLFRALTIPNIILLIEYVLSESRIILLSAHVAMLQLVSKAILELVWPFEWTGIYIPVLPSRLVQALDAPCPYICGIDCKYEKYDLPDDDYVLVDLDKNELHSTAPPPFLPKQQRRKLMSLLYQAAPLHQNFGVAPGPPSYAMETYPYDAFSAELESTFTAVAKSTNLDKLASLSSTTFGPQAAIDTIRRSPLLNVFLASTPTRGKSTDRPRTSSTARHSTFTDSDNQSPIAPNFPLTPGSGPSRTDSGYALQTSLKEKRSGHFDSLSKRSFSGSTHMIRKASIPFVKHNASPSSSTTLSENRNGSMYAPSTYAQSTLAASTIMPGMSTQPVRNGEGTYWSEGHCLQWRASDGPSTCLLCDEKAPDGYYRCSGCGFVVHDRCIQNLSVVCSAAFYPDQIRAAFVRCMASLLYTYRKCMQPAPPQKKKLGAVYSFDNDAFLRNLPPDHAAYMGMLQQTQAWNEFIMDREEKTSTPSIALFDAIIMAKRRRAGLRSSLPSLSLNRKSFMAWAPSGGMHTDILSDASQHQWRIVAVPSSTDRPELGAAAKGRDYHTIVTRTPAKLEDGLFKQDEKVPNLPTIPKRSRISILTGKMNGLGMHAP